MTVERLDLDASASRRLGRLLDQLPGANELLTELERDGCDVTIVGGLPRRSIHGALSDAGTAPDLDLLVPDQDFVRAEQVFIRWGAGQNRHGNPRILRRDLKVDLFSPTRFYGMFEHINEFPLWADLTANSAMYRSNHGFLGVRAHVCDLLGGVFNVIPRRWERSSPPQRALILARAGALESSTGLTFVSRERVEAPTLFRSLSSADRIRYSSDNTLERWGAWDGTGACGGDI